VVAQVGRAVGWECFLVPNCPVPSNPGRLCTCAAEHSCAECRGVKSQGLLLHYSQRHSYMAVRYVDTWHGLPPQPDIEVSLLRAIERRGGSITASRHKEDIMRELAEIFDLTEDQLRYKASDGRNLWWNWIRHVRRMLVAKGELRSGARDVWTLSASGRERIG